MAVIVVEIPDVPGQSTVEGFTDKLDAVSVFEEMLVTTAGGARPRAGRTVGRAKHRDIQLVRYVDKATPKLKAYCSTGKNLGEVKIHMFRSLETGVKVYFTYTLGQTFISRIQTTTTDGSGQAFQSHQGPEAAAPGSPIKVASRVLPAGSSRRGSKEVEHMWLNAATVLWTYTPYAAGVAGGKVERGWNIQTGVELAAA